MPRTAAAGAGAGAAAGAGAGATTGAGAALGSGALASLLTGSFETLPLAGAAAAGAAAAGAAAAGAAAGLEPAAPILNRFSPTRTVCFSAANTSLKTPFLGERISRLTLSVSITRINSSCSIGSPTSASATPISERLAQRADCFLVRRCECVRTLDDLLDRSLGDRVGNRRHNDHKVIGCKGKPKRASEQAKQRTNEKRHRERDVVQQTHTHAHVTHRAVPAAAKKRSCCVAKTGFSWRSNVVLRSMPPAADDDDESNNDECSCAKRLPTTESGAATARTVKPRATYTHAVNATP